MDHYEDDKEKRVQEKDSLIERLSTKMSTKIEMEDPTNKKTSASSKLIEEESSNCTTTSVDLFWFYFQTGGWWFLAMHLFFRSIAQCSSVYLNFVITIWGEQSTDRMEGGDEITKSEYMSFIYR